MESKKEKLELLQTAIKQLIQQDKTTTDDASAADFQDEDHHLLSKLLSEVEALRGDDTSTDVEENDPGPEDGDAGKEKTPAKEESGCGCGCSSQEEIVKELRNARKQNFITHCLLSALILLTVTWQLSEVSIILKLKDGLNHPFRSIGGILSGMLKGGNGKEEGKEMNLSEMLKGGNGNEEGKENSSQNGENIVIQASVPGLKIPELPHAEIPSLDFDRE